MANPWGKSSNIGAWAAEAEREEEEAAAAAATAAPAQAESLSFPSLKEAVSSKPKKNKKMSLTEFYSQPTPAGSKGLTPDEMLRLPTAPRERSAEELQYGRLGGGFSNYGRSGPAPASGRVRDESDASWGSGGVGRRPYGGGFENDRRGNSIPRVSDFNQQPSRADEVDNWAVAKNPIPSFDSGRQSRYPGSGPGVGAAGSRADEVDNWAVNKKPIPPATTNRSSSFGYGSGGFGSGFHESGRETQRWGGLLNRETTERERPRLVLNPPKGDVGGGTVGEVKVSKPSPFGAARPGEEVLAEKGLDWKKMEMDIEAKKAASSSGSRPMSAHSNSRPSSGHSNRSEGIEGVGVRTRPKVNPFGDAKPREILLQERGQDWRKMDLELEHRAVERPITEQEKLLKEEIENLKNELEKGSPKGENVELEPGPGGNQPKLQDVISQKERELEILIHELDDKVRFGSKAVERPGSGAGRVAGFAERPQSRSGSFDDSRSTESMDGQRPRSRGTPEVWTRPADERRGFQYGRDRRFTGSRDFDRSSTRERW